MDRNNIIESGGFYFIHNFDSGNLGHVERVPTDFIVPCVNKHNVPESPDYEFNLWTRPDCAGTEFENGNRTWFYFGVQAPDPGMLVRLNLINLNKQGKMYNQGMAPVTRTLPGKPQWERIRDRPLHATDDNTFTLSFKFRTPENSKATTFFAFTYPFSFAELQIALNSIDLKMLPLQPPMSPDDIYYCRECLIYSLEGRRLDLLTITSHHGITTEREEKLKNLFPEKEDRPFKFTDKKVIFMSARVHPGETPSSFVFNGFLNLLLSRNDPVAVYLRRFYVFKLIPFLNPDGVARGHYRTDTRGVNLNRVYLNPALELHPTVYAARALIRYYHFGCEKEDNFDDTKSMFECISECSELQDSRKKKAPIPAAYKRERKLTKSSSKGALAERKTARLNSGEESTDQVDRRYPKGKAGNRKNSLQEESMLADQVLDMKIHEIPSQTSDTSFRQTSQEPSLLSNDTLRCCLGSNVHLTTSEEMNMTGRNPLRPLRDALKDSIGLLMDPASSATSERPPMKVGWCRQCRAAVSRMEDAMPGITSMVPGYSAEQEMERLKSEGVETFFCTNCFKRYLLSDQNEEISVRNTEADSESAVSAGDNSVFDASPRVQQHGGSTGDVPPPPPSKSELPKPPKGAPKKKPAPSKNSAPKEPESGLFLYIDLHGHASKKGIFMYGNHFTDAESSIECMLLPRVMSLNNMHFHFSSCNFTERNMYLKDRRDGMSREGSGRVAVFKATGLVRSYTLECNYNTGRLVNVLPPSVRDGPGAPPLTFSTNTPPKYTPPIFEDVGRSLGASILDLTGQHPNSRLPASEHRNIAAVRDWLRHQTKVKPLMTMSRLRPKTNSPSRSPLYVRPKPKLPDERKENAYGAARRDERRRSAPDPPSPRSGRSGPDIAVLDVRVARKQEPVRPADPDSKQKSLTSKRRNILAIRKPNASKTQVGGVVKAKLSRRSIEDDDSGAAGSKLSKRSLTRIRRVAPSSSSDDGLRGDWALEPLADGAGAGAARPPKRRVPPAPSVPPAAAAQAPNALKKIRLKTAL